MAYLTFTTTPLTHQHHLCLFLPLFNFPSSSSSSSLNSHHFPSSHFLPSNHTPFFLHPKLPATLPDTPTAKTVLSSTSQGTVSGFPSLRPAGKRVERKSSVKDFVGSNSVEEENAGKRRFTRDGNLRRDQGFRKRREFGGSGSGDSSFTSKKRFKEISKPLEVVESKAINGKTEKKSKKVVGGGRNQGKKEEKIEYGSEKSKGVDPKEVRFRVKLDMCSKRGDVMGAIQLYDLAQREGIKLGQYHYTVLLYLCSSAAVGVVKPAKSGSNDNRSSRLTMSSRISNVNQGTVSDDRSVNGAAQMNIHVTDIAQPVVHSSENPASIDNMELNSSSSFDEKENLARFHNGNGFSSAKSGQLDDLSFVRKVNGSDNNDDHEIRVSEEVKNYALRRGLEIYDKMRFDEVPLSEATLTAVARMAMSMDNGDMAFAMVKQMKQLGINPRLRSYIPALSTYCNSGDVDKAFAVEKHMLENGVHPEEPELEALLRVSVDAGKGNKVYYLLHKLRTCLRKVSPSTASIIVRWFRSKAASRVGKRKWDRETINKAIADGGGGWHGQGWLGRGKWSISCTSIGTDAVCGCCGENLVTIDLDTIETENFAESVASIAIKRDKDSSFQKFQKWLDYYGPFEAVIDGANVGLLSKKRFLPAKINAVVNGIRQKLPSKKWPLIVLHNRRITGYKMDEMANKALVEKWKNADALYLTPTGSNDDWYWLYAAIKFKCLIVTNDEMRDHTFQLLGNDFFPKWKERHQVHFSFTEAGPIFHMPPPYSVVIQESEKGHWHIPIATDQDYESEREWVCVTRSNSVLATQDSVTNRPAESQPLEHGCAQTKSAAIAGVKTKPESLKMVANRSVRNSTKEVYKNLRDILSASVFPDHRTVLSDIEAAEKLCDCVIDFQI